MSNQHMKEIRRCLTDFRFQELFIEHLGWNRLSRKQAIQVDEHTYVIEGAGEKSGLAALVCTPAPGEPFPGTAERKRLERAIEKDHHEHLIIFVDADATRQIWSIPRREDGKTKGTSEIPFFKGKGVEHLARRVEKLSFSLDESESATLIDVSAKVNQALLAEKVTKKFFKEFSDQRKSFVQFLGWIEDESKRDWYCSVLLNRLMFIYFLGGKGFLPGGTSFLANNLEVSAKVNGPDTFYTHFLLPLSFFGLGERQGQRGRFEETFNDVLYLDGGLFAVHQVERDLELDRDAVERGIFPPSAKIPDAEFRRWFAYFDKWRWTLDEDKVENDGYISPHILGYIFEKYINQKQMGAYYTKEDITGYICRNTIIPRLFDMLAETGDKGSKAVRPLPIGPHPNLMNDGRGISDGEGIDRYIYASVKQEAKLPTETDYEQEQRRKRYEGILEDFDAEKIRGIDDFITYNLDIERLALDFVSNIQDPEVLHAFYFRGIQQVTVLDPTCGSGAFLLAALNILYPLYNAALSRMRFLVGRATGTEPDVVNWAGRLHFDDLTVDQSTFTDLREVPASSPGSNKVLDDLRAEVERINDHPSAEYFIKKSIIVNNLFGVDIMEEAVEICKLRLFLTLIATVERDDSKANFGVEPLPDIDFNILAGNTLVGYTSIADIDRLWHQVEVEKSTLAFDKDHSGLSGLVAEYGKVLKAWRLQQLGEWKGAPVTKEQVFYAVEAVRPELNKDLWNLYKDAGLATIAEKGKNRAMTQVEFIKSHEPFHWVLEFPAIEASKGFDVIVGNPPWKEYSVTKKEYQVIGYSTIECGNLYALCSERATLLERTGGRFSFIVQLPLVSSSRMRSLRRHLLTTAELLHVSPFDDRPGKLFENLENCRSVILLQKKGEACGLYVSRYNRWQSEFRPRLMEHISYAPLSSDAKILDIAIPKLSADALAVFIALVSGKREPLGASFAKQSDNYVFYQEATRYWIKASVGLSHYAKNGTIGVLPHGRYLYGADADVVAATFAILMSSTFYLCFQAISDCFHVNQSLVEWLPLPSKALQNRQLSDLGRQLDSAVRATAKRKVIFTKDGNRIEYDEYKVSQTKGLIDKIDELLGELYGLSPEQIQVVKNYDLRYRMGQSDEEEVE